MIDFLKKHKERVTLLGLGLGFLFFVGGGIYLQENKQQEVEPLPAIVPKKIELKARQSGEGEKATELSGATASFFLKPSPGELLADLAAMENLNKDVVNAKFTALRVLWPAYFFTLQEIKNGSTTLLLDVSEDGFGVVISSEIEVNNYPRLKELAVGEKVWIGGEIMAVDPGGTGTIYLKAEHITYGEEPPISKQLQEPEN